MLALEDVDYHCCIIITSLAIDIQNNGNIGWGLSGARPLVLRETFTLIDLFQYDERFLLFRCGANGHFMSKGLCQRGNLAV